MESAPWDRSSGYQTMTVLLRPGKPPRPKEWRPQRIGHRVGCDREGGDGPPMLVGVIAVFGTLYLDPARRDEALREFHQVVADTTKEPGCHAYVISADLADPCTLYIFEEWKDSDALEAH